MADGGTLSYRQLEARANGVAAMLEEASRTTEPGSSKEVATAMKGLSAPAVDVRYQAL